MTEYTWIGKNGNEFKLTASVKRTLVDDTIYMDGYNDVIGKKIREEAMLTAYMDGKKFNSCWNTSFWGIIETRQEGLKRIHGIDGIGFTEETAREIQQFLNDALTNCEETEEVKEFVKKEKISEANKKIDEAKRILDNMNGKKLYETREEAKHASKVYNDINNEGGEGYLPHFYTIDEKKYYENVIAENEKIIEDPNGSIKTTVDTTKIKKTLVNFYTYNNDRVKEPQYLFTPYTEEDAIDTCKKFVRANFHKEAYGCKFTDVTGISHEEAIALGDKISEEMK